MKITGYRSLSTVHDWGRVTGDVNGVQSGNTTPVPVLVVETDAGIEGVGLGAHNDIARVFPAVAGEDPRSVIALRTSISKVAARFSIASGTSTIRCWSCRAITAALRLLSSCSVAFLAGRSFAALLLARNFLPGSPFSDAAAAQRYSPGTHLNDTAGDRTIGKRRRHC